MSKKKINDPHAEREAKNYRDPIPSREAIIEFLAERTELMKFHRLAEEIAAPGKGQIRALITIAGNPVISAPDAGKLDQALPALDCMVSQIHLLCGAPSSATAPNPSA